jgi:sugar lactone lactonase YvrE
MPRRACTLLVLSLAFAPLLRAAGPQFWRIEGPPAFLEGDVEGLSVTSDGQVRLGPQTRTLAEPDAPNAWSVARDARGAVYLGTGNDGRVLRIDSGQVSTFFQADELEVHAVACGPDGRVYAATSPDGAVYAIDATGKPTRFFDPEDRYIWALAFDGRGRLYVATGSQGRVYRVSPDGHSETLLSSSEGHILSLAIDDKDRVYAGSAPEGIVYRLDEAGHVTVMLDSDFGEIKALAAGPNGVVYAAAVGKGAAETSKKKSAPTAPAPSAGSQPVAQVTVTESFAVVPPSGGQPVAVAAAETAPQGPVKGALLRIRSDGQVDTLWRSADDVPYAALRRDDGILVGTGGAGNLYRVDDEGNWALVASLQDGQVTALAPSGPRGALLVTSNPARLVSLDEALGPEGTFVSKPHDSGTVSRWGRLSWEGSAPTGTSVRLQTRSGNTETPDSTWTDWSPETAGAGADRVAGPPARFLQVKLTLVGQRGATPTVDAVAAAFLQRNRPPEVRSITVHPPGEVFQKPISVGADQEILGFEPDPLSDRALAARPTAGTPPAVTFSRKLVQRGLQTVSWQADDPNGDPLLYDVEYRAVADSRWRPLRRGLDEPVLAWDTSALPNGRYLLRVVASDAPGNPAALALTSSKESTSFLVDNAPPRLEARLDPSRPGHILATARDDASPIRRLELSVDAGSWQEILPTDGIADSLVETYDVALGPLPPPGPHVVVLRASDLLGNMVTARVDAP